MNFWDVISIFCEPKGMSKVNRKLNPFIMYLMKNGKIVGYSPFIPGEVVIRCNDKTYILKHGVSGLTKGPYICSVMNGEEEQVIYEYEIPSPFVILKYFRWVENTVKNLNKHYIYIKGDCHED